MTKKLNTTRPTGAIVQQLSFKLEVVKALSRWLNSEQIEQLRSIAEAHRQFLSANEKEASLSEEKQALKTTSVLAAKLAQSLETVPNLAQGVLDGVFHFKLGNVNFKDKLVIDLKQISNAINESLTEMPAQRLRGSHPDFVRDIAGICIANGIKPSESERSKFFQICSLVFGAARLPQSPKASIRAFIRPG